MSEGKPIQVIFDEAQWAVFHGDCLDLLRSLPDCSIDSCVTDAPYHLTQASRGGSVRTNDPEKPFGRHNIGAAGFMGKTWDGGDIAFRVEVWAEVLRVLKPGGHLLAFGGTRTHHRMACAIEDAGFELRDSVHWIYGQGFPKSRNLSKDIDAHLGAEPTVVGTRTLTGTAALSTEEKGGTFSAGISGEGRSKEVDVTEPTTDEAKVWDGWGTALKPGHEPIILARKPTEKGLNVAENLLKWGTGAINVGGCRLGTGNRPLRLAAGTAEKQPGWGGLGQGSEDAGETTDGRWPPNVVFSHSVGCRRGVPMVVRANPTWDTPNRDTEPSAFTGPSVSTVRHANGRDGEASADRRYADQGSTNFAPLPGARRDFYTETVEQWECVDGCPVLALALQSGTGGRNGSIGAVAGGRVREGSIFEQSTPRGTWQAYPDEGSAVRYFPQFGVDELDDVTPFYYSAKPSRAERDAGLKQFRPRSAAEATDSEDGQARLASPRTGAGRTGGARNAHPTVKGLEIMRWLVRLGTPVGGIVLDPFTGSGSTGMAARMEGCRFIGAELNDTDEEPYVSLARARIHHVEGLEFIPRESLQPAKPTGQRSLFEVK